jgi:hypothetical protein
MAGSQRRSGVISVAINGVQYEALGKWTYNFGIGKREARIGPDGAHGYKETPQVPFIEGEFSDSSSLDVKAILGLDGETVTLQLANGKVVALRDGYYAHEGTVDSETGSIPARFEGTRMEEIA